MAREGCIQLTYIIIAPPDQVPEGDRIFRSHKTWMEATHHRSGDKALLSYDVSKAPELSNPGDPDSAPTGNTVFILSEVYRTEAGVADHYKQSFESWVDADAMFSWIQKCDATLVPAARIFNSLW